MSAKSSSARSSSVRYATSTNGTRRNITVSLPKTPFTQREAKTVAETIAQLVEQFEEFDRIDKFLTNMLKNAKTPEEVEALKFDKKELHAMQDRMAENDNPNIKTVKSMIGFWKRKVGMSGGKGKRKGKRTRRKSCGGKSSKRKRKGTRRR